MIVKCPKCNAEYFLEELFIPDEVIGKHKDVVKDLKGKIVYSKEVSESSEICDDYICDYCGANFKYKIKLQVEPIYSEETDLSIEETTIKI
jgi:hypothetical protein